MKSQDIYILMKLICLQQGKLPHSSIHEDIADQYSARALSAALGVSKTEVNASIWRSINAGMAVKDRRSGYPRVNEKVLFAFIVHGLKPVFPVRPAEIVRGVPTAFYAPILKNKLLNSGDYIWVWPYAKGSQKGQSIKPLFRTVPKAALEDEHLYEYLALIDAIRLGRPREENLAIEMLENRLTSKGKSF